MLYRNKRTGAVIDINGIITGDTWERLDPPKVAPVVETEKPKKTKKTSAKKGKKK